MKWCELRGEDWWKDVLQILPDPETRRRYVALRRSLFSMGKSLSAADYAALWMAIRNSLAELYGEPPLTAEELQEKIARAECGEFHIESIRAADELTCTTALCMILPYDVSCPACGARVSDAKPHCKKRDYYRCGHLLENGQPCGKVYGLWTHHPILRSSHRSNEEVLYILRGIVEGVSTAQLASELHCCRKQLGVFRKKLEALVPMSKWTIRWLYSRDIDEICCALLHRIRIRSHKA